MPTNNYRELKKESIKKTSLDLNDALLNTLNIRIIFLNELSIKYSCKPNSVNPRGNLFTSLLTVSRIISLYTYTYTSTKCTHVQRTMSENTMFHIVENDVMNGCIYTFHTSSLFKKARMCNL